MITLSKIGCMGVGGVGGVCVCPGRVHLARGVKITMGLTMFKKICIEKEVICMMGST